MSVTREQVLKELGIAPVWRLKQQLAAAVPAASNGEGAERRARIMQMDWVTLKDAGAACTACELHKTRTQGVLGVGDEKAEWLIIGEAPGAEEDVSSGKSGPLFLKSRPCSWFSAVDSWSWEDTISRSFR